MRASPAFYCARFITPALSRYAVQLCRLICARNNNSVLRIRGHCLPLRARAELPHFFCTILYRAFALFALRGDAAHFRLYCCSSP